MNFGSYTGGAILHLFYFIGFFQEVVVVFVRTWVTFAKLEQKKILLKIINISSETENQS